MSPLSRKIVAAVEARASDAGAGPVAVDDGPNRLALEVVDAHPLGVSFDALEFASTAAAGRSPAELKAWGDRLAGRLTYLLEPLVVLEVDAVGLEVELRSASPTARDATRSYYEARLRSDGSARLRRLAFDAADRRRHPVPCRVTLEVLERLADDLVATSA